MADRDYLNINFDDSTQIRIYDSIYYTNSFTYTDQPTFFDDTFSSQTWRTMPYFKTKPAKTAEDLEKERKELERQKLVAHIKLRNTKLSKVLNNVRN